MEATAGSETVQPKSHVGAGQLAWGILLIAFAAFCVLCVVTGVGLNYFLFQSTVPMQTIIRVGRGTVTWTDATRIPQATSSQIDLYNRAVVSTDTVSQAMMFVYDQYHETLVAILTLKNDSSVDLVEVARPRFDFSSAGYSIELDNTSGELDVQIMPTLGRNVLVKIHTPDNGYARLLRPGTYTISASDSQLQVINYSGDAMVSIGENPNYAIPAGQRGTIQFVNSAYAMQPFTRINLLGESTFHAENIIEANRGVTPPQYAWGCNSQQNNPPSGYFALTQIDGLNVLRLGRGEADSHGETFCSQYLVGPTGGQGADISNFNYLGIRATFKIINQSLSTCGTDGSECAMMLRLEYVPQNGGVETWYHGFFSRILAGYNYTLRCASCVQDHEIVNPGGWYTYDSGNLLSLFQTGEQPRTLLNFRFYASGHEYDVVVSEMALVVGQTTASPTN